MLRRCLLIAAVAVFPSLASAFDRAPEPAALAYLELPLGASRAGTIPTFGFRFHAPAAVADSFAGPAPVRPPLVDLRFALHGFAGLYVNGINVASPSIVLRAAEGGGGAAGINWLVVGGIVAIGAVGIAESNRRSKPQTVSAPAAPAAPAPTCPVVFPIPPAPGLPPAPPPAC